MQNWDFSHKEARANRIKNDTIWLKNKLVLKCPRFFCHQMKSFLYCLSSTNSFGCLDNFYKKSLRQIQKAEN